MPLPPRPARLTAADFLRGRAAAFREAAKTSTGDDRSADLSEARQAEAAAMKLANPRQAWDVTTRAVEMLSIALDDRRDDLARLEANPLPSSAQQKALQRITSDAAALQAVLPWIQEQINA